MAIGISVDWPGIEQRLDRDGGDEVDLQLTLDDPTLERSAAAFAHAEDAQLVANEATDAGTTVSDGIEPLPDGPVMVMKHPGPMDELHLWVSTFAGYMVDRGWGGRIVAAPHPGTGGLLYTSTGTPLSAFLAYRVAGSACDRRGPRCPAGASTPSSHGTCVARWRSG